jgi:aryl-alcohol dehydrogenase-like predicted oxidoreductase
MSSAANSAIILPAIALVLLTAGVWVRLYVDRIRELRQRRIDPQALATSASSGQTMQRVQASDNFKNLFEDFAAEFGARTWAQLFLKFILGHPAVTAVIPGTDKPEYMLDNLDAGRGALPDAAMRKRIVQYWESLA